MFRQDYTCPALLFVGHELHLSCTGLSPAMAGFSKPFHQNRLTGSNWAAPRSLATTCGISVDFYSSGYLDVSIHRVCFHTLFIQAWILIAQWVSPFRDPRIEACLPAPRGLSQATTSFFGQLLPRHPPYAFKCNKNIRGRINRGIHSRMNFYLENST